jgi:hypothetical protein
LNKGKRRILFDRPKPTAGCSANGRRRSPGIDECAKDFTAVWKLRKQKLIIDGFISLCMHHQHYPCHFYPFLLIE